MQNVKSSLKKMIIGGVATIAGLMIGATNAHAAITSLNLTGDPIKSTGQTGSDFTGTVSYNSSTDVLTLTLKDTTPSGMEGYLDGFAFDIDKSGDKAVLATASDTHFLDLNTSSKADALVASGIGTFQDGAALDGSLPLSMTQTDGLTPGQTGTFTFNVSGTTASSLSAYDFVSGGFVASMYNCGCDYVPADPCAAPLPSSVWAGLMGLVLAAGAVGLKRSQRVIA